MKNKRKRMENVAVKAATVTVLGLVFLIGIMMLMPLGLAEEIVINQENREVTYEIELEETTYIGQDEGTMPTYVSVKAMEVEYDLTETEVEKATTTQLALVLASTVMIVAVGSSLIYIYLKKKRKHFEVENDFKIASKVAIGGIIVTIAAIGLMAIMPSAIADTIIVPDDYSTIQGAIDAAEGGDIIKVSTGTYNENIIINKPLTLEGENKETTIIDGGDIADTIKVINVNSANISGIKITNGNNYGIKISRADNVDISNTTITDNFGSGIYMSSSSENHFNGNTIVNNGGNGIELINSDDNNINNNTISNNYSAVKIRNSNHNFFINNILSENDNWAIFILQSSDHNELKNNTIQDNKNGIDIRGSSNDNLIEGNLILNSETFGIPLDHCKDTKVSNNSIQWCLSDGLFLYYSNENIITNNTILNNSMGIRLKNSVGNEVYYNNFIENEIQAKDDGNNTWDNGEGEGNYWNDYTGIDKNKDGIGDTPYIFASNQDNYPLMHPCGIIDRINDIIEDIEDMGLPKGIENSLISKLENTIKSIEKGQYTDAVNKLKAFIHQVDALKGKKLTETQADKLNGAANWIITIITRD